MRHFVSAGWPYLYDIPGLHNCVPMLFADVCARFHRLNGDEVFFLCGADEHGARTEYVAKGYGTTPQELLNTKFDATIPLLAKLELSFDHFGRTGDPFHKQFVQDLVRDLVKRERVIQDMQKVPWCAQCQHHLPDRFLEGTCPYCHGTTYGNQCNNKKNCSRLVEANKVIDPRCAVCAGHIEWRDENHLFLRIPDHENVCITRDTKWGIPIDNMPAKTIYSWVDSLLAKVSMLAKQGKEAEYWKDPDTQRHFFLGLDGTPFYGTLFPALLLASNRNYSVSNWNLRPNEVFIYEGGICSKSTGTGIWLQEALSTQPSDFWRFYIFLVHANVEMGAERDVDFRWERFCESVNTWLIKGLKSAAEASDGEGGENIEIKIRKLMGEAKIGEAFHVLMTSLIESPSRQKTAKLAPLLSCFLPHTGRQLTQGLVPFKMTPLYAPQVQMDYQDLVDERRSKRGLGEEITDARADALCVCPINLTER